MNINNNSNSIDKRSGSVWILLLGVVFINLYFNTNAKDPFNTPKLIALLLIAAWLFGHTIKLIRVDSKSLKNIQFYGLLTTIIFLILMSISAFLSDSVLIAFIGDTTRRNGLLSYIGLAVLLVFTMLVINFMYSIRLYKVAIINGLILGVYGLFQTFGKDFVAWNNPYNSLLGTLGNPNFASAMLAVFAVLALASLALKDISLFYKILALTVFVISIFCIYRSNSRQGFVSFGFALMFYVSAGLYLQRKRIGIIAATVSMIISIFSVLGMLQIGPLTSFLYKTSVTIRGFYWSAAIEMFKSNPLTGVGIDAYGYYFRELRDLNYPKNYGFEITSSNAHNVFLQFFSTGGVFLGITYIALTVLIFSAGIVGLRNSKGDERLILLGLLSGWLAYQASSFISIDNIGITVWNWLLGGAVLGLSGINGKNNQGQEPTDIKSKKSKGHQINLFQPVVSILVLIPILIFSIFLNRVENNALKVSGYASDPTRYREMILKHGQEVLKNPLADPNYRLDCALAMIDAGLFVEGFEEIKKLEELYPRNDYVLLALSEISELQKDNNSAIDYRIKLSAIDPFNAKNYLRLLVLYKGIGDLVQANAMQIKIDSLFPDSEISLAAQKELSL
jgi:O-antigen ligase